MYVVGKDSYIYIFSCFLKNIGMSGPHNAISRRRHCMMNSKSADNLMGLYMGPNGSLQRRNQIKNPIHVLLLIN